MNVPPRNIPAGIAGEIAPEPVETQSDRARVLLVDDDERNLLALATVLEDLGEVVLARSGDEALRHLLRGEFAVILLDVYMPGIDGYETAQIIREREQTRGIPIVFLSAVNKEAEHMLRGYAMGAVDYVFKPVDPVILRSKVTVFVDLFEKSKEIERKAQQEQALLDANLRAEAERLRVEQELRRSEQRQAAIIQSLPMVLYLEPFEAKRRAPTYVSGDLHAICGYQLEEVSANPDIWADRLHPDDRDRVIASIEARRRSGRSAIEYRWQCADGTYKHFLDQAVLLRDAEGKPIEFAGTLTDISEQRSLESQLIHAQKMDAIGKLTGGIAHDFNNLLAAVLGGLSLIERRATLNQEDLRILGMTTRAAEQGTELVRRLLAFARRQNLEPRAIDLIALKKAIADLLIHTLGGLIEIDWRIGSGVWNAFADQTQLELALVNLIINARDAMPAGGKVTISAENHTLAKGDAAAIGPGEFVRVAVADTGTGISPDNLEKVMEPFFTTKEVGKGSGLGLSMVYGFAKQSNGLFHISSQLGKGTTAELWLPRAPEGKVATKRPPADQATSIPQAALKILLVDDHAEVRGTTASVLEGLGHSIVEAANGMEAIRVLEEGKCKFDLLITDYAMPKVSGTGVIAKARELCPDVPALMMTGYAESSVIADRPEGVEVLLKPFTPVALQQAIYRVTEPQAVSQSAA